MMVPRTWFLFSKHFVFEYILRLTGKLLESSVIVTAVKLKTRCLGPVTSCDHGDPERESFFSAVE